MFIENGLI